MKRAVKVAITLADELLHRVDRARRERKVSRRDVDRYVRSYTRQPETVDEVEAARAASSKVLAAEPWD